MSFWFDHFSGNNSTKMRPTKSRFSMWSHQAREFENKQTGNNENPIQLFSLSVWRWSRISLFWDVNLSESSSIRKSIDKQLVDARPASVALSELKLSIQWNDAWGWANWWDLIPLTLLLFKRLKLQSSHRESLPATGLSVVYFEVCFTHSSYNATAPGDPSKQEEEGEGWGRGAKE